MGEFDGAFASAIEGRGRYLRTTRVQPRAVAGQNIAIEVRGLREAARIPEQLREQYNRMLRSLELELQTAARAVVPGSPTGRLGRTVHARTVSHAGISTLVIGTIGSDFARALNRGFTSTPKRKRALRFEEEGKVYYRMRARVPGKHFFEKWLALTGPIVEATYERSFYNIKDLI